MTTVPPKDDRPPCEGDPIDRSRPPSRDNPVAAALTAEQYAAFVGVLARLARSAAAAELGRRGERDHEAASTAPPPPPQRQPRPNPSRLAKWEAQWQADAEAES